jgi:hypothetical protein
MEEEQKTPKPKGGFREGAGRKPKDKVATQLITVKIRKDFLEIINKNFENRSDFIQKAVKDKLRREGLI